MVKYEDACFGPCGADCTGYCALKYKTVTILSCDKCDSQVEKLWVYGKKELCSDCLINMLKSTIGNCSCCDTEDEIFDTENGWLCKDCLEKQLDDLYEVIKETDYE